MLMVSKYEACQYCKCSICGENSIFDNTLECRPCVACGKAPISGCDKYRCYWSRKEEGNNAQLRDKTIPAM